MKSSGLKPSSKPWRVKPGAKGLQPSRKRMKSQRRAIAAPTALERDYQRRIRELACCVICRFLGLRQPNHLDMHHRNLDDKHGAPQIGEWAVVMLCAWHHDGVQVVGYTVAAMTAKWGPSFKFAATFRRWTAERLPGMGRGTEAWQAQQDVYLASG